MHPAISTPAMLGDSFGGLLAFLEEAPRHAVLAGLVREFGEGVPDLHQPVRWHCARSRVQSVAPFGTAAIKSFPDFRSYCETEDSGRVGLLLSRVMRSHRSELAHNISAALARETSSRELRVLTLNVWGLSPLSGHFDVDKRCKVIVDALKPNPPDIILLQEVWHSATKHLVKLLDYPWVVSDGRLGNLFGTSGLALLSRHPVVRHSFRPFSSTAGVEYLVRKGVLFACVDTPQFGPLELFNVHLMSEPERLNRWFVSKRAARELRENQIGELRQFAAKIGDSRNLRVFAGDFNVDERDQEYSTLKSLGGDDLYRAHLGALNDEASHDSDMLGFTFDPSQNRFAMNPCGRAERIDHVWLAGAPSSLAIGARRRFTEHLVSDHFGVEVSLARPKELR